MPEKCNDCSLEAQIDYSYNEGLHTHTHYSVIWPLWVSNVLLVVETYFHSILSTWGAALCSFIIGSFILMMIDYQ